jgi:hypothetical protein
MKTYTSSECDARDVMFVKHLNDIMPYYIIINTRGQGQGIVDWYLTLRGQHPVSLPFVCRLNPESLI